MQGGDGVPCWNGDLQSARQIDRLAVSGLKTCSEGERTGDRVRFCGEMKMGGGEVGVFGETEEPVFRAAIQTS